MRSLARWLVLGGRVGRTQSLTCYRTGHEGKEDMTVEDRERRIRHEGSPSVFSTPWPGRSSGLESQRRASQPFQAARELL